MGPRSKTFYSLRTSDESLASSSNGSSSGTDESFESPRGAYQFKCPPDESPPGAFRLDMLRAVRAFSGNTVGTEFTLLRKAIEPHLRKARLARELCSRPEVVVDHQSTASTTTCTMSSMIGSTVGFPYPSLRAERRFLYCQHSFPLHDVLSSVLGLDDLTKAHLVDETDLLLPMLHREQRVRFQAVYDSFVLSVCLPLLHSLAMSNHIFQYHHRENNERVTYRYQAFPTIQVSRPEDFSVDRHGSAPQLPCHEVPTCDTILSYSPGCLTFHVPLTPCGPANSMYTETRPGREDWHPLDTKAIGLGYLFDGARCLSFYLPNTSNQCSVALTFRVQICQDEMQHDMYSSTGPGYYEEAIVNLQPGSDAAISKKSGQGRFLAPDHRNGYPFI
jgi:hypothetical protein